MEQRKELIARCLAQEESRAELARQYGVSRQTVYQWMRRCKPDGEAGLEERSRAPHVQARALSPPEAARMGDVRRQHPRWGPRKILAPLKRKQPRRDLPAARTVGALLKREGWVVARKQRWRVPSFHPPRAHAEAPHQVGCADCKGGFRGGHGERGDPLPATDACSRSWLRCPHVPQTDGKHGRAVFEAMFREEGLPEAIRTDHGPPFASQAPGGWSRLSMGWRQWGLRHERIEPGCPQQNGRHERRHPTLQQETATPPRANRRQPQEAFRAFAKEYNYERPHAALGNRTPAEGHPASSPAYPSRLPELAYPAGAQLRGVSPQGRGKWKSRRTLVSEVLARQAGGLIAIEEERFELFYGSLRLGWLDGRSGVFPADRSSPTTPAAEER